MNSPLVQSLICQEQSARGWGPHLYGVFEDGRIEELLDCETLDHEKAFTDIELCEDVARAKARFHSHNLPLIKQPFDHLNTLDPRKSRAILKEYIAELTPESDILKILKKVDAFPFEKEIEWIKSIRSKIKERIVLANFDPCYQNIIVKKKKPNETNLTRSCIIDFDFTKYGHRGYDLGGHFVNRCFHWTGSDSKLSGCPYPSESEKIVFLKAYLKECKELFIDFDENALDSLDNVMIEADIGALVSITVSLEYFMKGKDMIKIDPSFMPTAEPFLELYIKVKENFCKKYPHLNV